MFGTDRATREPGAFSNGARKSDAREKVGRCGHVVRNRGDRDRRAASRAVKERTAVVSGSRGTWSQSRVPINRCTESGRSSCARTPDGMGAGSVLLICASLSLIK